jgi:hypothetical protein
MQVLKHKRNHSAIRSRLNFALAYLAIASSILIVAYAIVLKPENMVLLLALSPVGLGVGSGNLRYIRNRPASPRDWMYEHLGAMLGGGIAFHTAFAVFGSTRIFDIDLTGWVTVVPWILPAAIGIPATFVWTRYYRRKFGDLGTAV